MVPGEARQLNYFVGRRYSLGSKLTDKFLGEATDLRNAYQLEVGAAVQNADGKYLFGATVEDFINSLKFYGVDTSDLKNVLQDDFKPADFKIDLDKLVNYGQYYWLPYGPEIINLDLASRNSTYTKLTQFSDPLVRRFDSDYFYVLGKNTPPHTTDTFPNTEVPRAIAEADLAFKIPLNPETRETLNQVVIPPASMVGVAINGQPFYTYTLGSKEKLNDIEYTINTVYLENNTPEFSSEIQDVGTQFTREEDLLHHSDTAFRGHPDADGIYHYHAYSAALGDGVSGHSKILGYAFDGFPIYGPRGYLNPDGTGPIVRVTSSYRLTKPSALRGTPDGRYVEDYEYVTGLGMLDENNGRFAVTPEYPQGTYAYFMTLDPVSGDPAFPYILGTRWAGNPVQQSARIKTPDNATLFDNVPSVEIDRDIVGKSRFSLNDIEFVNGMKIYFDSTVIPANYRNNVYYVEGVGKSIELIPETELIPNARENPREFSRNSDLFDSAGYSTNSYDGIEYRALDKHYVTINRASQDRNAWSRSNRWFHYRVLEETAKALNKAVTSQFEERARRPIIEFEANTALWNHSRRNVTVVDLFDTEVTDALSTVMSSTESYLRNKIEGIALTKGMKVVYAADLDPEVRNKVYEVDIVNLKESDNYSLTLPQLGGSAPGPFPWVTNTGTQFHVRGNFTNKEIKIKQNGVELSPGVDYTYQQIINYGALSTISLTEAGVIVEQSGSGYLTNPTVTITGDGVGATAEALIDELSGTVVAITVTNPGRGYTNATISISPPPIGTTATAIATRQNNSFINEERITVTLTQGLPQTSNIEVLAFEYSENISLTEVAKVGEHEGVVVRKQLDRNKVITPNSGRNWYYLNNRWRTSTADELKTSSNQAPLFDLFDENYVSLGDQSVYVGSTFRGNKLFSYRTGSGTPDAELGFPVSYRAVGLTGDLQFDWNHSTDNFDFTIDAVTRRLSCESFYSMDSKNQELRAVVTKTKQLPQLPALDLRYIDAETKEILLKVSAIESEFQHTVLVEVNDKPMYQGVDYDLVDRVIQVRNQARDLEKQIKPRSKLVFRNSLKIGDKVLITQWTDEDIADTDLIWKLPLSLVTNPYNQQIGTMTFGDISTHLTSGAQLLKTLDGIPLGNNNLFNESGVHTLCKKFGYHNGTSLVAMALLKNRELGYVQSLEYAKDEFTKFKNSMIQRYEFALYDEDNVIPTMLDNLLDSYTSGKTQESPFYDSDMVPGFANFVSNNYTVRYQQDKTYPITSAYVDEEESRRAVLVYHNGNLLLRHRDYNFNPGMPYLTLVPGYELTANDVITVREYDTTEANWIPTTPAKLGLAPAYQPGRMTIPTPNGNVKVIQGHDGSWTPAFGDQRDALLLEIENRIYNNIKKTDSELSQEVLNKFSPLPGKFRSTARDLGNAVNIMDRFFGQWILKSRLDFSTNSSFDANNSWTWNYRGQRDVFGDEVLVGNWFGLYRYYFDTEYPHLMPWKMLGFAEQPTWWEDEYGPSPYTRQNAKLWDDIQQGLIRQGPRAGVDVRYARGTEVKLQTIVPVNENGEFLSPLECGLVRIGNRNLIYDDWIFGDAGAVEQAWIRSSEFPFAVQMYKALINSRYYFGSAFDLLDTKIDSVTGSLQRIIDNTITDVGAVIRRESLENSLNTKQTAGYFTWIEARSKALSIDPQDFLDFVTGIQARLMYRMTGFTDKEKIQLYINSISPGSKNALSLLPDNNYQLILDQSAPTANLVYSGVTVTKTTAGWRVEGYDTQNTYFYVLPSIQNNDKAEVRVGATTADVLTWRAGQNYVSGQYVEVDGNYYRVLRDHTSDAEFIVGKNYASMQSPPLKGGIVATLWKQYSETPAKVQYGTVYRTAQEVFDFLQAYGRFLENQGFLFDQFDSSLGQPRDWLLSGKEFLFWTLENWRNGSVVTLSPASRLLKIYIPQGELDPLYSYYADPRSVLDQNFLPMRATDLAVNRNFDLVTITPTVTDKSIYLLKAVVSDFDHLAIFDNTTDFNDMIFNPTTGARQERLKIRGSKSNAWNGKLFAPGFTLDLANIIEWSQFTNYVKGDLIKVGNKVYSAIESHRSGTLFDYSQWSILPLQPDLTLQPNLESLASRLEKFYGLGTEQVSSDVSMYARHLIGFQPREYLNDLLVDDETQFKFYQGMIKQKGTSESVAKLLRGANPGGIPAVEIKDEWALRVGEFGLADNVDEVEILISVNDLEFNKVMLDLSGEESYERNIIAVEEDRILDQGELEDGNLFPTANKDFAQKNAGYARIDHVDTTLLSVDDLNSISLDIIGGDGKVIWIAKNPRKNSMIYRTRRLGPFTVTVLPDSVLSVDSSIPLEPGDPIWFLPLTATTEAATPLDDVQNSETIIGYRTVDQVRSVNRFKLKEGVDIPQGQQFETFIIKFDPAQYPSLVTSQTCDIRNVKKANPAIITFDSVVDFASGQRIFVDSVEGMSEINNRVFYLKKLSATTASMFFDRDFLISVDADTYTDYTSGGRAYFTELGVGDTLYRLAEDQRLWIDNYQGNWTVFKKKTSWTDQRFVDPNSANTNRTGTRIYSWNYRSITWAAAKANLIPSTGETSTGVVVFERPTAEADLGRVKVLRSAVPAVSDDCDFGAAISSMDIDTLIVGCPLSNVDDLAPLVPGSNRGAVQLWRRDDSGDWKEFKTIYAPVSANNAKFGAQIARIRDNFVLVSAPGEGKIYKITYDDAATYSVFSASRTNPVRMEFASLEDPGTVINHGLTSGEKIELSDVEGMTQIDGEIFYVKKVSDTEVDLYRDRALTISINGTSYDTYISGSGRAAMENVYRVLPVSTGLTVSNQGFVLEHDNGVVAIADTETASGHVRIYMLDENDVLVPVNSLTGTATVPITTDSPIDVTSRNGRVQVAVGTHFPQFTYTQEDYDDGSVPTDSTVTDGIVRIFEVPDTNTPVTEPIQIILPPSPSGNNVFGITVKFTDDGTLLISNSTAPVIRDTTFDNNSTLFDAEATEFKDLELEAGAVETYGWYGTQFNWVASIANPISRVEDPTVGFGIGVSTLGKSLMVGAPWYGGDGRIYEYTLASSGLAIDEQQTPTVDASRINRAMTYDFEMDRVINFQTLWDPLKDLHDSVAITNLDYIGPTDPAIYQEDNPGNTYWAEEQVGRTWWDNSKSIWLWYEQADLDYKLKNWGRLFPGTDIVVCEWVESPVVPAGYNPDGSDGELGVPPLGSAQPYSTKIVFDSQGASTLRYYFWVANKPTISQSSTKTISAAGIRNLLLFGPNRWVAPVGPAAILTQNLIEDVNSSNVALQIEVLRSPAIAPRHVEWALLNEGDDIAPPSNLVNKIVDSLAGQDAMGNPVPDSFLHEHATIHRESEEHPHKHKSLGIKLRPRQTVFLDRLAALQASTDFINDELSRLILVDRDLGDLNKIDSEPLTTEIVDVAFDEDITTFDSTTTRFISEYTNWNESVATYADIIEDDLPAKEIGYKILVNRNEKLENLWTIYAWDGTQLVLDRVQKFDTTRYWSKVDYYSEEFPKGTVPDGTVRTEQEFLDGDFTGKAIKILGPDFWRVLKKDSLGDITVLALQNGTVELDITQADFDSTLSFDSASYDVGLYDPQPTVELRNILSGMQNSIFIQQYRSIWNRWFFHMVRYALSEQRQLDWAFKSSFIKVKNTVAELTERPVYSLDIQDSLEKYIREVKPYHTKIREYAVAYTGTDQINSLSTDFDNPPHYENGALIPSNVLDPSKQDLYRQWPWRSYRDGRSYSVVSIVITDGGSGYISPPTVTLSGGTTVGGVIARNVKARAVLGVQAQDFPSLGAPSQKQYYQTLAQPNSPDDNYFNFRKVWLDRQASRETGTTLDTSDLPVKQAPNADGRLLSDMVGNDPHAIKRIEILDEGAGYLTPPTVIITGGGGTGAKAYAVLGDTSTRMFRTGLKFDRVKGTADILYKDVRAPQKDNPGFDDWHAADRIAAYYEPTPNQISLPQRYTLSYDKDTLTKDGDEILRVDGVRTEFKLPDDFMYPELLQVAIDDRLVDPSEYVVYESSKKIDFLVPPPENTTVHLILNPPLLGLMLGADFDKTKIVGPKFDRGPGFDSQGKGFDSIAFDNWDLDPNGGYVEFGGIDTYQESGRFLTAPGYDPSTDILSDGSGFLTPDTSPATEELLSGQIFDTLDIKVYSDPGTNQTVYLQNFRSDGSQTNYSLDPVPDSNDNITVFVEGLTQNPDTDFTVNYSSGQLIMSSAPPADQVITVTITQDYGPTIERIQTFIANGTQQTFTVSNVGPANNLRKSIVIVNGVKVPIVPSNSGNNLVFNLGSPPAAGSLIRIVIYLSQLANVVLKNYAESFMQTLTLTGATNYSLDHVPGVPVPFTASTVVSVVGGNESDPAVRVGQRLTPADVAYYTADGSKAVFNLPDCPGFNKAGLLASAISVSVNGRAVDSADFELLSSLDQVRLATPPANGSLVCVTVLTSGDYYVTNSKLYINASVVQSSSSIRTKLLINTYNDTALTDMRTEVFTSTSANSIYYGGFGVYGFGVAPIDLLSISYWKSGQVKLSKPIVSVTQANVYKNGVFLLPGQDWFLVDGTRDLINIAGGLTPSDTVVVHYFSGSLAKAATGFRIFKDMLGRFKYYRISAPNSTRLTQALGKNDNIIYLDDATGLAQPNRSSNRPGILMIGKERIEYWVQAAGYVSDLRRGTGGTGAADHAAGTLAVDMGPSNELPPSDVVQIIRTKTDGETDTFDIPVELETAFHSAASIQVFLGGKLQTRGYTLEIKEGRYSSVKFDRPPAAGVWLSTITKQGANWNNVLEPERSLQDSNTLWAEFIRGKPTVIESWS